MRRNEDISVLTDPKDLDRHFIYLYENMDDLTEITEEEHEFGFEFMNRLGINLENQEILQISATPTSLFCLVVKSFRRSKI